MKREPGPPRYETEHWPEEVRLKSAEALLEILYDDGKCFRLPAELLRVESPSAEVQGHSPSQKRIVAGKRAVGIRGLEPVGHYAVRIQFDDGHETGLFTWSYLRELGERHDEIWQRYLDSLAAHGLSRDPS